MAQNAYVAEIRGAKNAWESTLIFMKVIILMEILIELNAI